MALKDLENNFLLYFLFSDQDWVSLWSLPYNNSEDQVPSHLGLTWLVPLWVDRAPEVS